MWGVSGWEGEEAFLWQEGEVYTVDSDGDGPPGLSKVIWFYVRWEV